MPIILKKKKPVDPRNTDPSVSRDPSLWPPAALPDITTHPKIDPHAPKRTAKACLFCGKPYLSGGCDQKTHKECPNYLFAQGKLKGLAPA